MKIEEVKKNLNKMIVYKDNKDTYMFNACILKRGNQGFYYNAELLDVKARSLLICPLNDIEPIM